MALVKTLNCWETSLKNGLSLVWGDSVEDVFVIEVMADGMVVLKNIRRSTETAKGKKPHVCSGCSLPRKDQREKSVSNALGDTGKRKKNYKGNRNKNKNKKDGGKENEESLCV